MCALDHRYKEVRCTVLYNTLMLLSYIACRTPRPILLAVGWVLGNLYYLIIAKMRRRADDARARHR